MINYDYAPGQSNADVQHAIEIEATWHKEVIYCPAQTYRATRETPAEWCENEVPDYGDLCASHDEADRLDADYEAYKEARDA